MTSADLRKGQNDTKGDDEVQNGNVGLTTQTTNVVTTGLTRGLDIHHDYTSKDIPQADMLEQDNEVISNILSTLKESMANFRDDLNVLPLDTAITSLRHDLGNENYTRETLSVLRHHLIRALLTRYGFLGRIEDLEQALSQEPVVTKTLTDHRIEQIQIEEAHRAIELIEGFQPCADTTIIDDIIQDAEESMKLCTEGSRASQRVELLILLGNALVMKFFKTLGEQELANAAHKFREAQCLCDDNIPLTYISLAALAHIGWIRAIVCGDDSELVDARDCMARAQAIDEMGAESFQIGVELCREGFQNPLAQAQNLQEGIDFLLISLSCREHPHPQRSSTLGALYTAHWNRFGWGSDIKDLENCILWSREGFGLGSRNHPDRVLWLNNLANALGTLFEQNGTFENLEESIMLYREALYLTPSPHSHRSRSLNNLATALSDRFKWRGDFKDLEECILLHREALALRPPPQPSRSTSLSNLAIALSVLFEQKGTFQDLEESIQLHREAVGLRSPPHPLRATSLINLGNSLSTRFEQKGGLQDLEESILLNREALELLPSPHPDRPASLNNMAGALWTRFGQKGTLQDLEESILLHREALDLRPSPHPDRSKSLDNLANALSTRFEQIGAFEDLEECVLLHREALGLVPPPHPYRFRSLNSLATALSARFKQKGTFPDLLESIQLNREALNLTSPPHPDRSGILNNLAAALSTCFRQKRTFQDLEESILLHGKALDLRPSPHPDRSRSLDNLASSLLTRFTQTEVFEDLEKSILLHREALALRPQPHPDRSSSLNNLADALSTRSEKKGILQDIEESISLHREALELLPPPHPHRSIAFSNLAMSHLNRHRYNGDHTDIEQALQYFRSGSQYETGSLLHRLHTIKSWASFARTHRPVEALEAYLSMLELLPMLASIDLTLKERSDVLEYTRGVIGNAAQCAISHSQYETAVVFLSTGRSTFWSQALKLRAPINGIATTHPNLAEQYINISRTLERASHSPESRFNMKPASDVQISTLDGFISLSTLATQHCQIIKDIREISGLTEFLLPPSFGSLQLAGCNGPVILVNSSEFGCDALIMQGRKPVKHVALSNVDVAELEALKLLNHRALVGDLRLRENIHPEVWDAIAVLQRCLSRDMYHDLEGDSIRIEDILRSVLRVLWERVAYPLVMALALQKSDPPSRIWWCPSGTFVSLPIHAAGIYSDDNEPMDCLFHYAVSSYITSPQDLLHNLPRISPDFKIAAIIEPEAPGGAPLPAAYDELLCIEKHVPYPDQLIKRVGKTDTQNQLEDVISDIQKSSIVHFGCHGTQNLYNPLDSCLLLSGGRLTMSKVIKECRASNIAALAYLSACETAKGDKERPDESLNLVATMMFAGFRSVVGTMWSIFDQDAPIVADVFYGHLFRHGKDARPDIRDAAYGLHLATAKLREQGRGFQCWVPYVHYGI